MLHSHLAQETSETNVVSAYPNISNSDPYHFPRCFRSTGSSTSVGWENLQETPMFHGKIMCNPLFPVKIFPPQSIHWSTGNSFHRKIRFLFLFFHRWLGRFLASLGRRTGSMFLGELISLSKNIWKQKTFSGAKSFESEAFGSVWQPLTLLRDDSIGECDPTWHNM